MNILESMAKKKYPGQTLIEFVNDEDYERLKRRDYRLRTTYDINHSDYEEIKQFQEGRCGICNQESDKLVVDHDHGSGAVRGLLCHSCNVMLGHAKDSTQTLSAAIDYLNNHRTNYCKPSTFTTTTFSSPVPLSTQIFYKNKSKKVVYESSKKFLEYAVDESCTSGTY